MVAFKFQIFLIPAVLPASHCPGKSSHLKFRNLFLPFPLSIPPKFTCLSAGKRKHRTVKGKYLYYLYGKRQRAKEKSLLYRLLIRTFTQGFYDRLLSRGVCDNMPTKGNVRRITSKTPYNKSNKAVKRKTRESEKAENFASGSARNSASLSFSVQHFSLYYGVCLSGRGVAEPTCHRQAHAVVPNFKIALQYLGVCNPFALD